MTLSITVAIPIPKPIHWVERAYFLFSRFNKSAALPVILAPVAPSGCPRARAPPSKLTLFLSIPKSLMHAMIEKQKLRSIQQYQFDQLTS